MAFTVRSVFRKAVLTLQDGNLVRWGAIEMLDYLNDGVREIAALHPAAVTERVSLPLAPGTRQVLPVAYTVLVRAIRNEASNKAITSLDDTLLMDLQIPGWQNVSVIPRHIDVVHVIPEDQNQREYLVVPGNTGDGVIEAIVGVAPPSIAAPVSPEDPSVIATYTMDVALPDMYQNALCQYVLHRCYSKDGAEAAAAQRAMAHLQVFQQQIQALAGSEFAMGIPADAAARAG